MDWTAIVTTGVKVLGGGGIIGFGVLLYKFSALQTTQTKSIESVELAIIEIKKEVTEVRKMRRPSEVCQLKIDNAVDIAKNAEAKVKHQTTYQLQTENKLSELQGVVQSGFNQITEGMNRINNAFIAVNK